MEENSVVDQGLAIVPEPYKTVIRKRLDDGFFESARLQAQERYSLTDEQAQVVKLMAFCVTCSPDDLPSLKDDLIADADVSYEVAVKLQRDITNMVRLIKEEGDSFPRWSLSIDGKTHGPYSDEAVKAMVDAGQVPRDAPAWVPGADGWRPLSTFDELDLGTSANGELFSHWKAVVTAKTVRLGGATYPVSTLASCVGPFFVSDWGFIGDIFGWGKWVVSVEFVHGEKRYIELPTRDEAGKLAGALKSVMA